MTMLEPQEIMDFGFTPGIDIGFLPQQVTWGTTGLLTVGFLPRLGTTFLPYDQANLAVKGASPPVTTATTTTTTTTSTTSAVAVPSGATKAVTTVVPGVIRPHIPLLAIASRVNPTLFVAYGLKFAIFLDEDATIDAVIKASFKSAVRGKLTGKASVHDVTKPKVKALTHGVTEVELSPSTTGRAAFRHYHKLQATLEVVVKYADKTAVEVKQKFELAPASAA